MNEFSPVRYILDKQRASEDGCTQSDIEAIEKGMWLLVEYLKSHGESFAKIARNMVKMLSAVLTAEDKSKINILLPSEIPEREKILGCLHDLHALAKTKSCWSVIQEIHVSFSAHCIKEAAESLASANKQFGLLQYNQSSDQEKIKNRKKQAEEKYEQVSHFCKKYNVSLS